ncbi:MAG TPA: hypothetical protein DD636_00660 [Anaerolineaceae bacterium]|nr:hypothetical protein [Anaerolineaceae bacterium]
MKMKTIFPLAVVLLVSFSPWILGIHLMLSFGQKNRTPLEDQVRNSKSSYIDNVIATKRYGNLKTDGDGSFSPLSEVILYSRKDKVWYELVEDLIRYGASVDEATIFDTPLQTAAFKNDIEMIRLLVKHGAKVDFPNCRGETPLMKASLTGNKEAIIELLALGANRDIRNEFGQTAKDMARSNYIQALFDAAKN